MKTVGAYILGFSITFTAISGGMYFMSAKYPWMFGASGAEQNDGKLKSTVTLPAGLPGGSQTPVSTDSSHGTSETINTLKQMLADKNDSISVKNDSIQSLSAQVAQLRQKNTDANNVISQLQSQLDSQTSQRKKDMASTYNEMDAGSAAKIMRNMSDGDIIYILSNVQKKQAAKILGELDPNRAAKLMSSLGKGK